MTEADAGLLDTCVLVRLGHLAADALPARSCVCSLSLAELAAAPHATDDVLERARRQEVLQRIEALFDPLPFDRDAARAYGRVYAATVAAGRKARGARAVDLMIAAVALSRGIPLYTANVADFTHLVDILPIVAVMP